MHPVSTLYGEDNVQFPKPGNLKSRDFAAKYFIVVISIAAPMYLAIVFFRRLVHHFARIQQTGSADEYMLIYCFCLEIYERPET